MINATNIEMAATFANAWTLQLRYEKSGNDNLANLL